MIHDFGKMSNIEQGMSNVEGHMVILISLHHSIFDVHDS